MSDSHENGRCYACGGMVDAKGMAMGGMVEGSDFAEEGVNLEGDTTQMEQSEAEQAAARKRFIKLARGIR
jgi:membrane protease subunit (stomatin/prohibitin family)